MGRLESVCTSRKGSGKTSTCEAWFALNRRAFQAVLNIAIQAELNMKSTEVTSRRRHDEVTCRQELAAELTTSADNSYLPGTFDRL